MAGRSASGLWKALAVGCAASCITWLSGAAAPNLPASSLSLGGRSVASTVHGPGVGVLQLNLCDSGIATCFTGRSVAKAAAVIRAERPAIVTLNEVCRDDVFDLRRVMSRIATARTVAATFEPAEDRRTNRAFRCANGELYGIGVLASIPSAAAGWHSYRGLYPTQNPFDPEERVWLCIDVVAAYFACTTHTASTSSAVALAQCRYLLNSAVPMIRARAGGAPVIVGADLNLPAGGLPDPQSCLPHGYQRVDDGSRQDVITSSGFALRSRTVIDMHGATDHPGLFATLTLSAS